MTENHISETSLRGETFAPVKSLAGFTRFHREPEDHTPRARRFVQIAGTREVADRAALLFSAIRTSFRYKRKEIAMTCDDGCASIMTPDFEVTLALEQDPVTAANYRLLTEVGRFYGGGIVNTPHFIALFAPYCDTVAIGFAQPIDLEAKIDQIEENDDLAKFLDYDAGCSWFALRLPDLLMEVTPSQMTCKLPGQGNLGQLIAQTQAALTRFSGAGVALGA